MPRSVLGPLPGTPAWKIPPFHKAMCVGTWLGKTRFQSSRHPLGTYHASCCSVAKLCLTLCDPMDCSMPGLPVPISQNLPSESWVIEKAECWRIDAFELWCWRRLLRIPWTARRSNQSILQELNPEYSLEGLKLKLQYFGHLIWTADSLEKTPDAGKDWRQEKRATEDEMVGWHHQFNGHELGQTYQARSWSISVHTCHL